MLHTITLFIGITLMYSTPLIFGALGGMISEKSGVTNVGIEGMMSLGAGVAVVVAYQTGNPWLGFLAAGVASGLLALMHAFASITCRADQTISGVSLNLLGAGIALFICRYVFGAINTPSIPKKMPRIFPEKYLMGAAVNLNQNVTVLIAFVLTIMIWFIFYKTKWGIHLIAVGEHPAAADTVGINVYKIRYVCSVLSGVLAGFGGASVTLGIIANFTPTAISGQGFIALAAVIFGKWKPQGVYGACLLFGGAQAIAILLGGSASLIPSPILSMLPYVLTIIMLIMVRGQSTSPKSNGVAYVKGSR